MQPSRSRLSPGIAHRCISFDVTVATLKPERHWVSSLWMTCGPCGTNGVEPTNLKHKLTRLSRSSSKDHAYRYSYMYTDVVAESALFLSTQDIQWHVSLIPHLSAHLCPSHVLSLSLSFSLSLAFSLCTCLLEPMPSHLDIEFRKAAAVQRVVSVVNMIPEPLLCTVCMEPFTPHRASVPRGSIKVRDADTGPTPNPLVT